MGQSFKFISCLSRGLHVDSTRLKLHVAGGVSFHQSKSVHGTLGE